MARSNLLAGFDEQGLFRQRLEDATWASVAMENSEQ